MYYFECLNCHKIKWVNHKSRIGKYCNKQCFHESLINRDITWGDKISTSLTGQTWDEQRKKNFSGENNPMFDKIPWNKGLTKDTNLTIKNQSIKQAEFMKGKQIAKGSVRTEEMRLKYSKIQKTKIRELSPNWNNGSSFLPYPPEFNKELKDFIKNRDLNVCQTSGCMNTEHLCIHHIDYDKKNNNPENLITLCNSCHTKTNIKNREYWTEYYKEIVSVYL